MIDNEFKEPSETIQTLVKNKTANILATLLLMKKDDGVEWNSQYGVDLTKLDNDLSNLFKRACRKLPILELALLWVDYNLYAEKHKDTLHCVECYIQTAVE